MKLDDELIARGRQLYRQALVWDMVWPWEPWSGNDLAQLDRFRDAGYAVVSMTIAGDNHGIGQAVQRVAEVRRLMAAWHDRAVLCETAAGIEQARADGKLAVLLHFEGTRCFERNLDMVEVFHRLGVRQTLLAFNQANSAGGGCMETGDGGLTRFGRQLIAEMERVGMLLDLSHTGHRTALDAMQVATRPCIYSHSNASAVFAHPRNISDEEMKACAATGGLVGLAGSSMYHGDIECRAESLFRHLDHMVQVVGPQHVGLGLDILFNADVWSDWMRGRPDEWPDVRRPDWPGIRTVLPEELPRLTACMLAAGYAEADVLDILGRNHLRIAAQVWK